MFIEAYIPKAGLGLLKGWDSRWSWHNDGCIKQRQRKRRVCQTWFLFLVVITAGIIATTSFAKGFASRLDTGDGWPPRSVLVFGLHADHLGRLQGLHQAIVAEAIFLTDLWIFHELDQNAAVADLMVGKFLNEVPHIVAVKLIDVASESADLAGLWGPAASQLGHLHGKGDGLFGRKFGPKSIIQRRGMREELKQENGFVYCDFLNKKSS